MDAKSLLDRIEELERRVEEQDRRIGFAGRPSVPAPVGPPCICGKPWWGIFPPNCPIHGAPTPLKITCASGTGGQTLVR